MAATNRFDDKRMREEALKAFVKALHTDRMVAITGAMSTEALGYPKWKEFIASYALIAKELAKEIHAAREDKDGAGEDRTTTRTLLADIADRADALIAEASTDLKEAELADKRVSMWTLHELFNVVDREMRQTRAGLVIKNDYQPSALRTFEKRVAAIFLTRLVDAEASTPRAAAVRPLIESLGIKRVATLNYDLELERAFMLRRDEHDLIVHDEKEFSKALGHREHGRTYTFKMQRIAPSLPQIPLLSVKYNSPPNVKMASVKAFIGEPDSGKPIKKSARNRLSRTLGNGDHIESDVVSRERPDRLFEFAVGSAEVDRHILHLHGRADVPDTMVANIRQYDRLYRLDDLYHDPFDHGLRMLIGGNPILFVGIGMNEQELNDTLQYFVSNVPVRRPAPTFVLWNRDRRPPEGETEDQRKLRDDKWAAYKRARRLDFRVRLGVHLLFDDDVMLEGTENIPAAPLDALPAMMEALPGLVRRIDARADRRADVWRSIDPRLTETPRPTSQGEAAGPFRMWGSKGLARLVKHPEHGLNSKLPRFDLSKLGDPDVPQESAEHGRLIFATSPNGYGRGELSEYLARCGERTVQIGEMTLHGTLPRNRLLINAGFSYDSDTMLSGIARFLKLRADPGELAREIDGVPGEEAFDRCRERYFANGVLLRPAKPALIIVNGADRFFGADGTPLSAEFDHLLRCVAREGKDLQILLLGTHRLRHYCEALGHRLQELPTSARINRKPRDATADMPGSSYLDWVGRRFQRLAEKAAAEGQEFVAADKRTEAEEKRLERARHLSEASRAQMRRAATVGRDAGNRTFFEAHLAPAHLRALGLNCPATFEVLRTLCFIGTPVEAVVLLFAPKVRAILAEKNVRKEIADVSKDKLGTDMFDEAYCRDELARVVRHLVYLGLLLPLDPHDPSPPESGDDAIVDGDVSAEEVADVATVIPEPSPKPLEDDEDGHPEIDVAGPTDEVLWQRYGLHRSFATFLRDHHGAPINDAKLATTFNMATFLSEPSDATAPEPSFHDELGDLVDRLIGAWHDVGQVHGNPALMMPKDETKKSPELQRWLDTLPSRQALSDDFDKDLRDLHIHPDERDRTINSIAPRAYRSTSACLRAGLSIVRGYYSTGALLKLDRDDRIASVDRDGALTEHAQRLDRLISAFGDVATARRIARRALAEGVSSQWVQPMGPEPFYPDDLVWLYNERATVALAQGHMFEARDALASATQTNSTYVEEGYQGHNWRRIAISDVAMRIERGSLKPAERVIEQIDASINAAPWRTSRKGERNGTSKHCIPPQPACPETARKPSRVESIRAFFDEEERSPPPVKGTPEFTREEMFVVAMTTGYRGLIAHLRGRYHEAKAEYAVAVRMMRHLGEQRAYAHFQRHYAALEAFFGKKDVALQEIEHAVTVAQAARQMDILHRARVVRADLIRHLSQDTLKRRNALEDIKEALRYAALADCYRVRIEASASLARHMRTGGDYDTALRYAADAMTIAARYGHSLQKTSLRIELGRILDARGDPISGRALYDLAVAIGTSKGYNLALERARRALNPTDATNWTYVKING